MNGMNNIITINRDKKIPALFRLFLYFYFNIFTGNVALLTVGQQLSLVVF